MTGMDKIPLGSLAAGCIHHHLGMQGISNHPLWNFSHLACIKIGLPNSCFVFTFLHGGRFILMYGLRHCWQRAFGLPRRQMLMIACSVTFHAEFHLSAMGSFVPQNSFQFVACQAPSQGTRCHVTCISPLPGSGGLLLSSFLAHHDGR